MTNMTKQTEAISAERALKLALEALEIERNVPRLGPVPTKTIKAITALREALAEQPAPATELREQEPKKDLMYSTVAMQERHAAFVDRAVATLEQAKREALALVNEVDQEQPAQQEFVCSTGLCYYKAQQQEPVAWLRKSDLVELRACNYMRLGADSPSIWAPNAPDEPSPDMELVAVYTSPPAQEFVCSTGLCHYKSQQQEPVAWKWENKETGKSGVYLENPEKFFDLSVASIYDWTPLYTSPPAQRTWVGLTDEDIASLDLSAVTVKDAISDVRAVETKLKEKNA